MKSADLPHKIDDKKSDLHYRWLRIVRALFTFYISTQWQALAKSVRKGDFEVIFSKIKQSWNSYRQPV